MTPAHQRTAPGGLARHHKPIRSRHQQFVSLVCRGARDQEFLQDLQRTQHRASVQTQRAAAQEKVRKLEKALEVMSDVEGPAGRSKRRGGASIGRSGGAVRIFHIKIAATVGRAGQTTSGRGRTLGRSQGPVGIGRRAVSRSVFCDKCRQRVDTVACPSRGATCRNRSPSEVSPSVDGRGPPSLDNVPPLWWNDRLLVWWH